MRAFRYGPRFVSVQVYEREGSGTDTDIRYEKFRKLEREDISPVSTPSLG